MQKKEKADREKTCRDNGKPDIEQKNDANLNEAERKQEMEYNGNGEAKAKEKMQNEEKCEVKAEEPAKGDLELIKAQLEEKSKQCNEYINMAQRIAAEFDNYRKRTAKEKEALYSDAVSDVVGAFLPVLDSIEKAVDACKKEGSSDMAIREGVELINRQVKEVLSKLGVEEIKAVGMDFDPELHNAVMHIEDAAYGKNVVVEELRKGYIYKDKVVIRHSMVKVAN